MPNLYYDQHTTALLLIDPYNDFLSEEGKVWPFIREVAEEVDLLNNLRTIDKAVRETGIQVVVVPHRRWQAGDYECWCHPNPTQQMMMKRPIFVKGEWGSEWHPDFAPKPGDIVVQEHWAQSGFANTDLDFRLKQRGISKVIVVGFRRPGAEIKEGLIPVNMFFMSQGITDNLSADAFVQLEWDQTVLDNCGTFFSVTDVVQDGCDGNYHILDPDTIAQLQAASAAGLLPGVTVEQEGLVVPRGPDRDARDSGQWGLSLRWQGDEAEYAAYVMNYHSRLPIVSTQTANSQGVLDTLAAAAGPLGLNAAQPMLLGRGNYFLEYPEDIRLYGVSFSTTLPTGTAWSGEISYRPNMPLQVNTVDLTAHLVTDVVNPFLASGFDPAVALAQASKDYHGYQRKEVTQAQSTFIHFFDQAMGADRVTLIGEVGITRIGAMTDDFDNRFGRDSIYGVPETALAAQRYGSHGFYTTNSWGYRARAIWDFNNVIAGVNIKPNLAWSHDVEGNGPVFTEGTKAASVGIDAEYLNAYTASLSYTNFFGGDYNTSSDRDFVALSVGVNF
ncbi:DUF1302 family protein [Metapseudomonas furukawaii]|uniref:DUF1302 family protein n=1 Tax=Metapseudomonas furukawaii TaxID=1149133 RepID=UPI00227A4AA7|nr:DUF1302 family protein [Pseudomonas furukawaii]WAG80985.1 DUF1302 family protein [Pseudomonas furukawaii]